MRPAAASAARTARSSRVDRVAAGLLVLAVATVVGGLVWTIAGGGGPAQMVFIGGAAVATVPLSIRALLRWGRQEAPSGAGMLSGMLVPSIAASIAAGITIAIALATPAGQGFAIAAREDGQSWFSGVEETAAQILITTLLPSIGGLGIAVTAMLVVGLPWLAIRRPSVAAPGSDIEVTAPEHAPLITRLILVGLAPLVVGIGLWVVADESLLRLPRSLGWVLDSLAHGRMPSWYDLQHVLGVLLVAIGVASVGTGIVLAVLRRAPDRR